MRTKTKQTTGKIIPISYTIDLGNGQTCALSPIQSAALREAATRRRMSVTRYMEMAIRNYAAESATSPALKPIMLPAKIVDRLREIAELANLKNPDRALAEAFLEPLAIRDVAELPYHIVEGWDLGRDRKRIERECMELVSRWQAEDES